MGFVTNLLAGKVRVGVWGNIDCVMDWVKAIYGGWIVEKGIWEL